MKDIGTQIMENLIKLWYSQQGIKVDVEVKRIDKSA